MRNISFRVLVKCSCSPLGEKNDSSLFHVLFCHAYENATAYRHSC